MLERFLKKFDAVRDDAFCTCFFFMLNFGCQAITAGVLAGCSDAVAQKISGIKKLQLKRVLLLMVWQL